MRARSQGIALPVVVGLMLLTLVLIVAMGVANVQMLASASNDVYTTQAYYAADGGLQAVTQQFGSNSPPTKNKPTPPEGWTGSVGGSIPITGFLYSVDIADNSTGTQDMNIYATDGTTPVTLVAAGKIYLRSTGTAAQQKTRTSVSKTSSGLLTFLSASVFADAIFATGDMRIKGLTMVDAYNSSNGPYVPYDISKFPTINAPVGTNSGTITIDNSSLVDGNILLGSRGAYSGPVTGYTGTVQHNAAMPAQPPVTPPTISGTPISKTYTSNDNTLPPGTYVDLKVSGAKTTLTLTSGTYYFTGNVQLVGNSTLAINAPTSGPPVIVYVDGTWDTHGGTIINKLPGTNDPGLASNFQLYGTTTCTSITLSSNGSQASAAVYAPNAAITLSGNGTWYGAISGQSLKADGGVKLHYDLALQKLVAAGTTSAGSWRLTGVHRW